MASRCCCGLAPSPCTRNRGLALALAWLLHYGREGETLPRWPFETFWKELACEKAHDRSAGVTAAANAIFLHVGVRTGSKPPADS
jgi:hypothetical protein